MFEVGSWEIKDAPVQVLFLQTSHFTLQTSAGAAIISWNLNQAGRRKGPRRDGSQGRGPPEPSCGVRSEMTAGMRYKSAMRSVLLALIALGGHEAGGQADQTYPWDW